MGGKEGFEELARLAHLLGGAVGASRPPVDSGWINTTAQVVSPARSSPRSLHSRRPFRLEPAPFRHVGLTKDNRHQQRPDAYIFKVSDYGVVGDWRKVLPAFTDAVERLTKEGVRMSGPLKIIVLAKQVPTRRARRLRSSSTGEPAGAPGGRRPGHRHVRGERAGACRAPQGDEGAESR